MKRPASAATNQDESYLGMSDDDFVQINGPAVEAGTEDVTTEDEQVEKPGESPGSSATEEDKVLENKDQGGHEDPGSSGEDRVESTSDEGARDEKTEKETAQAAESWTEYQDDPDLSEEDNAVAKAEHEKTRPAQTEKKVEGDPQAKSGDPKEPGSTEKTPDKKVDLEDFYAQVMKPFKANGRTIELKTPEEVIRLMQMGAGFGRKIQDLQPHLKTVRMLEKNDLLDPERLSFLIDINNKNPEAIKKLIKDSGIDPLDFNNEDNVDYLPTNHAVSDREMVFQEALSDIQSRDGGQETLKIVNQTWDAQSKSAIWDQPEILRVIQEQRENGVYDQIVAEVDRQKILGTIPHTTPFLQAYKKAGDHLQANNGFKAAPAQEQQIQEQSGDNPQPQVIASKAAAPKSKVANSDKAAAASPTKSDGSVKSGGSKVNPLSMADDEFLKTFEGRL